MDRVFQGFIDRLNASKREHDLREALQFAGASLDLHRFTYLGFPPDHADRLPVYISTYPQGWIERYAASRYDKVDPVVQLVATNFLPFEWGTEESLRGLSKKQRQVFDEASEFGIRQGLTIPIHAGHGRTAALTFASDQREGRFQHTVRQHRDLLHLIGIHFHAHVSRKLPAGPGLPRLTPREVECLRWSAHGKTRWEIAVIVGLKERTVAFHLENVRRKLRVYSTREAVAKAVQLGLVSY